MYQNIINNLKIFKNYIFHKVIIINLFNKIYKIYHNLYSYQKIIYNRKIFKNYIFHKII